MFNRSEFNHLGCIPSFLPKSLRKDFGIYSMLVAQCEVPLNGRHWTLRRKLRKFTLTPSMILYSEMGHGEGGRLNLIYKVLAFIDC